MLLRIAVTSVSLLMLMGIVSREASAKDKHTKRAPAARDEIRVVAHVAPTTETVTGLMTTQQYSRQYLYAEHASGKTVSLMDITNTSRPALLAEMTDPAGGSDSLVAATGNAALVASDNERNVPATPQTFRIMNFADPMHPAVQQEFKGVTAMARDDQRGVIFLANAEGIWILQQQYAVDAVQAKLNKEIERSVYETP